VVLAAGSDLPVSWGAGSLALALLVVAIAFNVTNQRTQRRDIRDLKRENVLCNYRTAILVEVLSTNGIAVPGKFWETPAEGVAEMNVEDSKHRGRSRFDLFGNEEGNVEWASVIGILALILVAFFVIGGILNHFIVEPLHDVQHRQTTEAEARASDSCVASLTADYFVAIKRALAAPPAPNPERGAAIEDLNVTAERIRHRVPICSDGKPDSYKPAGAPVP
jgi:hypothetical protein